MSDSDFGEQIIVSITVDDIADLKIYSLRKGISWLSLLKCIVLDDIGHSIWDKLRELNCEVIFCKA